MARTVRAGALACSWLLSIVACGTASPSCPRPRGVSGERLLVERAPAVRTDLEILIAATGRAIDRIELEERLVLPFDDVAALVYIFTSWAVAALQRAAHQRLRPELVVRDVRGARAERHVPELLLDCARGGSWTLPVMTMQRAASAHLMREP